MKTDFVYTRPMRASGTMTAEELFALNIQDKRTELVRGVLVVREPPGVAHGYIALKIGSVLRAFAEANDLGVVVVESGFKLFSAPDTVRGPDVSFIRRERVPDPLPVAYAPMAPDLAVEIASPGDRPGEMLEKVADLLNAGTSLIWIVDAVRRCVRVYRADGSTATVDVNGALSGDDVLPGFSCPVADLV
jgi:Uma2 family endonuclease